MGLLDDAIREHLELKRRRGADPDEVAREQHEALEPVASQPLAPALEATSEAGPLEADVGGSDAALEHDAREANENPVVGEPTPGSSRADVATVSSPACPGGDRSEPEETAELDMRTVLEEEPAGQSRPLDAMEAERVEEQRPGLDESPDSSHSAL